eukprot:TRINITY_DN4953_c0_g2_i2.p1 TRINITY_DN4953_c0_g2~~TRINITY_DN4953_c0_g2_i2.p1  ORF type:complete len:137 (-),score=23.07 TRINITY_DN4953_c0_g2_i2:196-606(-)
MTQLCNYNMPVIEHVASELKERINLALEAGIYPWHVLTDVGIGFAKQLKENLSILHDLNRWQELVGKYPLVVGTSRKKFIGQLIHESDPKNRDFGTAGTICCAIYGGAHILRVHDVIGMSQVVKATNSILGYDSEC